MSEYIEREALLALLEEMSSYNVSPMCQRGYDDCVAAVLKMPAADVAPVVHGWFVVDEYTYPGAGLENYKCSVCDKINGTWKNDSKPEKFPNYCWNCGAKMDGEDINVLTTKEDEND